MSILPSLRSSLEDALLLPPNAAFAARTTLEKSWGLGYTAFHVDALTCYMLGVMGNRVTVRHISGSTEDILSFFTDAGLVISERTLRYETEEQALSLARKLVRERHQLAWIYPPSEEVCEDDGHLVQPKLWSYLNDKRNLSNLAPPHSLPDRKVLDLAAVERHVPSASVFLKAANSSATGWGFMVRYCATGDEVGQAVSWFREQGRVTELIVEEAIDLQASWCMNIAVTSRSVTYVSGVEQVFASPGKQSGSIIDPTNPPPAESIELVKQIGEAARKLGFLGPAGIDVGLARDGRIYAFDPNFRFTSSYVQGLLHASAAARSDLSTSLSVGSFTALGIRSLLNALRGPVGDGWLVPTRIIDGALLPAAKGRCHYAGFVLGRNREQAEKRAEELKMLAPAAS